MKTRVSTLLLAGALIFSSTPAFASGLYTPPKPPTKAKDKAQAGSSEAAGKQEPCVNAEGKEDCKAKDEKQAPAHDKNTKQGSQP